MQFRDDGSGDVLIGARFQKYGAVVFIFIYGILRYLIIVCIRAVQVYAGLLIVSNDIFGARSDCARMRTTGVCRQRLFRQIRQSGRISADKIAGNLDFLCNCPT